VLFMFVTVDGEYPARNIFRRAQIGINYLSWEKKINKF
jgi:hypothetical protein